jgi:hypothetical protein
VRPSYGAYGKPKICFVFKNKNGGGMKSLLREVVKMLQLWKEVYNEELRIRIDGCIGVLESKTM